MTFKRKSLKQQKSPSKVKNTETSFAPSTFNTTSVRSTKPTITLETWINSALLVFALRHLPAQDPFLINLLNENALLNQPITINHPASSNTKTNEQLTHELSVAVKGIEADKLIISHSFKCLINDLELPLWQLFLLSLCAQTEESFQINVLLNHLQQGVQSTEQQGKQMPRAQIHLLLALTEDLFNHSISASALLRLPIVNIGLLESEGQSVLASRYFVFNHQWLGLFQKAESEADFTENTYIGGKALNHHSAKTSINDGALRLIAESMRDKIKHVINAITAGSIKSLVLRGERASALIIAQYIATQLKLQAHVFDQNNFNGQLALACHYANVLPVINLQLGPSQTYSLASTSHRVIPISFYLLGSEGYVVTDDGLLLISTAYKPYELVIENSGLLQRQQQWQQLLIDHKGIDSLFLAQTALISASQINQLCDQAKLFALEKHRSVNYTDIVRARVHLCSSQLNEIAQPVNWHLSADAFISSQDVQRQLNVLIKRCTVRENISRGLEKSLQTTVNTGVTALFYGASGAGKTLAASVVASQLSTPLYRIDLAGLMNKYIGETEKNLSRALDQAAQADVILLLDEADALFGQRSEGSGSGDRFANMLTNYLLTRIETHPGVVILTSNAKERIDNAFTRRLDVVVEFQLPNAKQRYKIWCHHFSSRIPSKQFCQFLADYCELSGGFIRNIVLNSAALDTGVSGDAIAELTVLECVRDEYLKLGRALPSEVTIYHKRLKANEGERCAGVEQKH